MTAAEPLAGAPAHIDPLDDAATEGRSRRSGGLAGLVAPLALRDFRLVWAGQAVSLLGDQFHMIALAWLVLDLTGSGLALGVVLMAAAIPRAVLIVVGGALADRIAPRRLIIASDVARGVTVGILAALALTGRAELWHLVAMGVVFGIADALFFPAMNAIVPALVPTDRLPAANAVVQGTMQLTTLLGPVVAGVLVVALGTGPAFALDAVSFGVAALAVAAVHSSGRRSTAVGAAASATSDAEATPARPDLLADIRAGARYAAGDPAIVTILLLSAAFNLGINGPIAVGLPWLADQRFAADAAVFGTMVAGFGLGALLGAAAAGTLPRPRRQGSLLLLIAIWLGVGMAAIGLAPNPAAIVMILATMGLGIGYINVVGMAWLQARVDPALIGRVMGLVMLASFGLGPVSLAIAGALVDVAATAMFLAAGALVVGTALIGFAMGAPARIDLTAQTKEI